MVTAQKATSLIVALFVGALMAAFLLPVALGAIADPAETSVTQDTGETIELKPDLNATLDSVDTTADSATYTVTAGNDSASATVDSGSNTTVTVDGADVTIAPTNVSTGQATTEYTYPKTYGWGGGAGAMWAILPVIIVLAVFLYFVYIALQRY